MSPVLICVAALAAPGFAEGLGLDELDRLYDGRRSGVAAYALPAVSASDPGEDDREIPAGPALIVEDTPRDGYRPEPPVPGAASKSNFAALWAALKKDPSAAPYPREKVTFLSLFRIVSFPFLGAARRTLDEHRDWRPESRKLIRPNGIGLSGIWEVTEETPYTGAFKKGGRALVIARASVFSDDIDRGSYRSFGMALKLYPTDSPSDEREHETANLFLIDDNGGTLTPHFTDAELTTHPRFSLSWGIIWRAPVLAAVALAQRLADRNPGSRQLYPLSELGLSEEERAQAKAPERIKLVGAEGMTRVDAKDFREELEVSRYGSDGLRFDVFAADGEGSPWVRIGRIRFTDSVVSRGVDFNLHFPHPRWRGGRY